MTLSAVSNKTRLNVEVTLNPSNRVVCTIASAGTAVHGSIQLNGNSIGIRKRLACTRVSYVNFARSTEGETYRDQAPAIRLRRSRRAVHGKAQGRATTAAALSPLCDRSGGDPVRRRGAASRRAGRLDAGRRPTLRWRRHSTPLREQRFPTATASVGVIASGSGFAKSISGKPSSPPGLGIISLICRRTRKRVVSWFQPLLISLISEPRQEQVVTGVTRRPDLGGQAAAGANGGSALALSIIEEASENP